MNLLLPEAERRDLKGPLQAFREHGYARLGPVLSAEGLRLLRERAGELMLGQVVHDGLFFQLDSSTGDYRDAPLGLGWQGPSLSYRKLEKLELDDRFRAWLSNPLFERVAQALLGDEVALYRAVLFNKGASGGSELPWHQDGGRPWGLSRDPQLQIWTALDDAPIDGGCLEVLPGSHRRGLVTPLGGLVPEAEVSAQEAGARRVPLPVKAGEALLVHNLVWHRSGKPRPGHRRLAFSACYLSADTRCVRKKRAPRRFFAPFRSP